jgi:hypothetical protein
MVPGCENEIKLKLVKAPCDELKNVLVKKIPLTYSLMIGVIFVKSLIKVLRIACNGKNFDQKIFQIFSSSSHLKN